MQQLVIILYAIFFDYAQRKEQLEKVALDGSVECYATPLRWCDLEL